MGLSGRAVPLALVRPGSIAHLLPVVTPAPAAPGAGRGRSGASGAAYRTGAALTAEAVAVGTGPGRLITMVVTVAAGLAAFGLWFTVSGSARRTVLSLARWRGRRLS